MTAWDTGSCTANYLRTQNPNPDGWKRIDFTTNDTKDHKKKPKVFPSWQLVPFVVDNLCKKTRISFVCSHYERDTG